MCPLFLTARNYSNVAMILLHAGADFDLANAQGYTPIHLAAREGLLGLAQSLCAFGCVVDTSTSDGNFPLHLAAKNGLFTFFIYFYLVCLHFLFTFT